MFTGQQLQLSNGAQLRALNPAASIDDAIIDVTFSDVVIDASSVIDVSGQGASGATSYYTNGVSHGGLGGSSGQNILDAYGSITNPVNHGLGLVSSRGGGAIKITASSLALDGSIRANAGSAYSSNYGGNAGGSVWLDVATPPRSKPAMWLGVAGRRGAVRQRDDLG